MALDFITTNHSDFNYPFPKPVVGKPCEPPSPATKPKQTPAPVAPFCHCDAHSYSPKVEQYQQLLGKEKKLCEDYELLRRQMVEVTNDILDHPCDDLDTRMSTIYQADYTKRTYPISDYRALTAAAQANVTAPVKTHRIGDMRCYVDPTDFIHSPTVRPVVHPAPEVHNAVEPENISAWKRSLFTTGRTEYQDTFSKTAKATWRSMQRYKEPLPSARRREDDPCA